MNAPTNHSYWSTTTIEDQLFSLVHYQLWFLRRKKCIIQNFFANINSTRYFFSVRYNMIFFTPQNRVSCIHKSFNWKREALLWTDLKFQVIGTELRRWSSTRKRLSKGVTNVPLLQFNVNQGARWLKKRSNKFRKRINKTSRKNEGDSFWNPE